MPIEDGFEQEIAGGLDLSEQGPVQIRSIRSWGSALAAMERFQIMRSDTIEFTPNTQTSTSGRVVVNPLPNTIINPPGQWTILPYGSEDQLMGFKAEDLADLQDLMQEFKVSEFRDILLILRKALGSKYYNQRKAKVSKQDSLGLILE